MVVETAHKYEPDHVSAKHRFLAATRETTLIVVAALCYSLVRGLTDDRVNLAFRNAERVIAFERSVGIQIETDLQNHITSHDWAMDLANSYYIYGYWPVLVGTILWLIVKHPDAYPRYRNALLASGALSLIIFAVFPLAPPRFMSDHGFTDTIALRASAYRSVNASALVNEYAAMPSLHFGWILLLGIAWTTLTKHLATRILGVALPALMFVTIIVTANHYIIDALIGGTVAMAGLAIAVAIERARPS